MDEQEFKSQADAALQSLYKKLAAASDRYEFEPDFNAGALAIEFEEPKAKFVVSPNTPVRQVWVSAMAKGYKLSWDPGQAAFTLDGEALPALLGRLTRQFLGRDQ